MKILCTYSKRIFAVFCLALCASTVLAVDQTNGEKIENAVAEVVVSTDTISAEPVAKENEISPDIDCTVCYNTLVTGVDTDDVHVSSDAVFLPSGVPFCKECLEKLRAGAPRIKCPKTRLLYLPEDIVSYNEIRLFRDAQLASSAEAAHVAAEMVTSGRVSAFFSFIRFRKLYSMVLASEIITDGIKDKHSMLANHAITNKDCMTAAFLASLNLDLPHEEFQIFDAAVDSKDTCLVRFALAMFVDQGTLAANTIERLTTDETGIQKIPAILEALDDINVHLAMLRVLRSKNINQSIVNVFLNQVLKRSMVNNYSPLALNKEMSTFSEECAVTAVLYSNDLLADIVMNRMRLCENYLIPLFEASLKACRPRFIEMLIKSDSIGALKPLIAEAKNAGKLDRLNPWVSDKPVAEKSMDLEVEEEPLHILRRLIRDNMSYAFDRYVMFSKPSKEILKAAFVEHLAAPINHAWVFVAMHRSGICWPV